MQRKILILFISLVVVIAGADLSFAKSFEPDEQINISVYEKINPAIVAIDAQTQD